MSELQTATTQGEWNPSRDYDPGDIVQYTEPDETFPWHMSLRRWVAQRVLGVPVVPPKGGATFWYVCNRSIYSSTSPDKSMSWRPISTGETDMSDLRWCPQCGKAVDVAGPCDADRPPRLDMCPVARPRKQAS